MYIYSHRVFTCIFARKYLRGASDGTTYFHRNICVCVCTCIVCVTTMDTGKKAYQVLAGNYLRKWYVFVDIVGTHIIQMHIHTTVFSFKFVSGG